MKDLFTQARTALLRLLYERTLLVLFFMFVVAVAAVLWNLQRLSTRLMRSAALQGASLQAELITSLRAIYTSNVVERVRGHGLEATHDYATRSNAIPLPITLTMELGQAMSASLSGLRVRLYSDHPFPWRRDGGPRDDFERDALRALHVNPAEPFSRFGDYEGHAALRVAVADVMRPSCVNCHNTHPSSPRRDWQVGDVRGVLEIIRPLDAVVAQTRAGLRETFILTTGLALLGLAALALVFAKQQRTALELEQRVAERTAAMNEQTTELLNTNAELERQIRERRKAEQKLAQERFLVDTLLETIPDHIYFKDRESRFLRINRAMAEHFKLRDPADAIGRTDFDFFTPEHAQAAFRDEQEIMRTGQPMIAREEKETWPGGLVSWVSTTKQCLRDAHGEIIGTFGISRDITKRKLAEERLRESEERLQSILDNTSAVIYVKDTEGRYLLINRQFEKLFHVAADQARGKTDYDLFPVAMADAFRANDRQVLESAAAIQFEETAPHDDGPHTYVSVKFPLCDAAGAPYAVCGVSTDITERKRAELALAQRTDELTRSNRELEQFAYVASHDLQEPLRMVASYTQLLARRYHGKLDPDADEFIRYAVDGARRMQTLINDLLAYSRVGTRGKPFAPTDSNDVLRRALDNLKVTLEDAKAAVRHEPLPRVLGDAVQLAQLFQNLIGNAVKFRGAEPPQIHITAALQPVPPHLVIAAHAIPGLPSDVLPAPHSHEWVFAVRDNGIGIEREYFDRIFVIFQRLHNREQYPGTGIGLAVCKKIVERHGGRIWVDSEPGRGSTFFFTLPHDGGQPA